MYDIKYKDKPNEVLYFTNRLEIGMDSVYEKLETSSHILNETESFKEKGNSAGALSAAYDSLTRTG